jgi:molybdopterin-guanine dinucleotide biosynthesis protein A
MGVDKAFVVLDGRSLIARAINRLRPQVDALAISANGDPGRFAAFGLPVLADAPAELGVGPLAGVAAGLVYANREGWPLLATAPCDAPFAPADYVARLASAIAESFALAAVAESARGLQPVFALWRVAALPPLRAYLAGGGRSPGAFLTSLGAKRVPFAPGEGGDAFANLNTPAELERARSTFERG